MKPLYVIGMCGLGDCLHQRGVIQQLAQTHEVWLETPWPSVYHDMPEVHLCFRPTSLRTQAKNAVRERDRFGSGPPPGCETLRIWYPPTKVRKVGSVYGAMCEEAGVTPRPFTLPVPSAWDESVMAVKVDGRCLADHIFASGMAVALVRPLVERTEWSGCKARNPDAYAYQRLFDTEIRDRFFTISIADVEDKKEWITAPLDADLSLHHGELTFEQIAALTAASSCVYSSPGFAVILAQAVGTHAVCVFGGYENSSSFSLGGQWSPYLGIDPVVPCADFAHNTAHDKTIDITSAQRRMEEFLSYAPRREAEPA